MITAIKKELRKALITIILSFVVVISCLDTTDAKCGVSKYIIRGTVKAMGTSEPMRDAQIIIFLDNYDHTSNRIYDGTSPDWFATSREGIYEAISYYLPAEGFLLFGERCEPKPSSVEIVVTKTGFRALRKVFSTKDYKYYEDKEVRIIQLPDVYLDAIGKIRGGQRIQRGP